MTIFNKLFSRILINIKFRPALKNKVDNILRNKHNVKQEDINSFFNTCKVTTTTCHQTIIIEFLSIYPQYRLLRLPTKGYR